MLNVLLEAAQGALERINALQRQGGPLAESWRLLHKQEPTAAFTTAVGTLERFLRQALGHPLMPNGNRLDLYHLLQKAAKQDYISADQQKRLDNMRSRRNHASHGGELRLTKPQTHADLDYLGQIIAQIMLGRAVGPAGISNGLPVQLFEKGRLEDHSANTALPPEWRFQYGQLVDELVQTGAQLPIGGDTSTLTYADLRTHAAPAARIAPPVGFTGPTSMLTDGSVFIPFTADLSPAPGHVVPPRFWAYINRPELFPGGWLHDVGLPITEPLEATVDKGAAKGRRIIVQAFQRTILTDDPLNSPQLQIERANVGTDYARAFPQ